MPWLKSDGPDYFYLIRKLDPALLESAQHSFSATPGDKTYASDFGARKLSQSMQILDMPERNIIPAWETCVRNAVRANIAVEDELAKATGANVSISSSLFPSTGGIDILGYRRTMLNGRLTMSHFSRRLWRNYMVKGY